MNWESIIQSEVSQKKQILYFNKYIWDLERWYGEGNGIPLQYSCLEEPMDGGAWYAAVCGVAKSQTQLNDFSFTFHFSLSCIGEGNGNPLQCSCLENPRDGGAWRAAVYGVTQSRTRLKQLSSSSSRKMVLMNLFAGQQWRCRHKEQTYGHGGDREERVGQMERVAWKHIHYHM